MSLIDDKDVATAIIDAAKDRIDETEVGRVARLLRATRQCCPAEAEVVTRSVLAALHAVRNGVSYAALLTKES